MCGTENPRWRVKAFLARVCAAGSLFWLEAQKRRTGREDKKKEKKKSLSSRFHHFSDAHFDRRTHTLNNKLTRVF